MSSSSLSESHLIIPGRSGSVSVGKLLPEEERVTVRIGGLHSSLMALIAAARSRALRRSFLEMRIILVINNATTLIIIENGIISSLILSHSL